MNSKNRIINWSEMPLLKVAICLFMGVLIADYMRKFNLSIYLMLFFFLFLVILFLHRQKSIYSSVYDVSSLSILILFCMVGYGFYSIHLPSFNKNHFSHFIKGEHKVVCMIKSDPKFKNSTTCTASVLSVDGQPVVGKLKLVFNKKDGELAYSKGDVIAFKSILNAFQKPKNPNGFDFTRYSFYKGIEYISFIPEQCHILIGHNPIPIYERISDGLRFESIQIFREHLKDQQLGIAIAMILGDKEHLSKDTYTSFSNTGAVHVLAVSGLHVGIVSSLLILLFVRLRSKSNKMKLFKIFSLSFVVFAYALITGGSPAVLRAAIMFSLLWIGRLWMDHANVYNLISLSAIILICYDPFIPFHLGFQFSYLALLSIIFFQPKIAMLYIPKSVIGHRVWSLVTVSVAAQILIFPLSIFYFNQFPSVFIISGVVAVVLAYGILSIGLSLLLLNWIPYLSKMIGFALNVIISILLDCIEWMERIPLHKVDGLYFSKWNTILFYIVIGVFMIKISRWTLCYLDKIKMRRSKRYSNSSILLLSSLIAMTLLSSYWTFRNNIRNELIVYSCRGHSVIDWFSNSHLYSSTTVDEEDVLSYTSKGKRLVNGGRSVESLRIPYGFLSINDQKIFIPGLADLEGLIPSESDILLLTHALEVVPYDFLDVHRTRHVVMDASIQPRKLRNQWRNACSSKNITLYDVQKEGAWIFKKH